MSVRRTPPEPELDDLLEHSAEILEDAQLKRWELVCQLLRDREELQNEIDRLMSEALNIRWIIRHRDRIIGYRQPSLPFEPVKADGAEKVLKVARKVNERL